MATMASQTLVVKSSEREAIQVEVEELVPDLASRKTIIVRRVAEAESSRAEGGDLKSSGDVLKAVDPEFVKGYQRTLPNLSSVRDCGLQLIFRLPEILPLTFFAFLYGILHLTTGHRFVEQHEKFTEIYRKYSRSHFIRALEVMVLLAAYQIYGRTTAGGENSKASLLFSLLMWFIVISWLFAPFLLNPCGFEWSEIVQDWYNWGEWFGYDHGRSNNPDQSWEAWWGEEQKHLLSTGFFGRFCKIIFHLRFFVYQYVLIYQLHVANIDQSIIGYCLLWSWPAIVVAMTILKIASMVMKKFNMMDVRLMYNRFKLFRVVFVHCSCIVLYHSLTMDEIFSCLLVFLPTGWGLLQIAEACRPIVEELGMWGMVESVACGYDILMGMLIFLPVVLLANFSFVSQLQAVMLFNFKAKAFSRCL